MSLRYYPISKVKLNRVTAGSEFYLNGAPYKGKYYETYDGQYFTGANPVIGKNEKLNKIQKEINAKKDPEDQHGPNESDGNISSYIVTGIPKNFQPRVYSSNPTTYFPLPLETDYSAGKFFRYFAKRINIQGYVIEISKYEYDAINAGSVPYDISMWQTIELFWKLTGPLKTKRLSQYDIRAGIEDTNKRLVENAEKTFVGIKAFIGEEYTKFARVTE